MQRNGLLLLVSILSFSFWQPGRYTTRSDGQHDPNGVYKYYMGRQIAMVMGHFGIEWLERPEREEEENVGTLLQNMALKPGEMVADIGAGSGYHVMRIAPEVAPNGLVYGVDIQPEMVNFLQKQTKAAKLKNVRPVLSTPQSVKLVANSIDKMLLVDVYHECYYPYEMAVSMLEALKPGGKLFLVEYRAEDPRVPIKAIHKMTEKQAVAEFSAVGFRFVQNISNLPWQHCMVFEKPAT